MTDIQSDATFLSFTVLVAGSTQLACNLCGRNGIGVELLEKHTKIAKKKVIQISLAHDVTQKVIMLGRAIMLRN